MQITALYGVCSGVLADDSVEHGPLEVLLTMTEEAGMDGAFGLQANWLQADILINTDSEEEGEIYMAAPAGLISSLPCHCPAKRSLLVSRPSS